MYYNILKSIVKNKFNIVQYPSFISFYITNRCNLKCIFCEIWRKKSQKKEELTPTEIEKIFKQLKRIDVLRITGGEPFMREDISEIINRIVHTNSPGIIHITSNGFLTEKIVNAVSQINAIKKIHIKISIDNIGKKHDKIRGIDGAYDKATNTINELIRLQKIYKFHIGINQAIINEDEISSYYKLKEIYSKYDIPIYPSIALDNSLTLNSYINEPAKDISYKLFNDFSHESLLNFMGKIIADGKKIENLQEQITDRYYLKGLSNRLTQNKNYPKPKCVALNNHLRLLPNGDVPVCFYNGNIIGNLKSQSFKEIWFGKPAEAQRKWVRNCIGCWASCETIVNAVYTGDIWKGLFF